MVKRKFGASGERVVLEEFLSGQEASYFVLADGAAFMPLSDLARRVGGPSIEVLTIGAGGGSLAWDLHNLCEALQGGGFKTGRI